MASTFSLSLSLSRLVLLGHSLHCGAARGAHSLTDSWQQKSFSSNSKLNDLGKDSDWPGLGYLLTR